MSVKRFRSIPFDTFAKRILRKYETCKAGSTADGMRRITEHVRKLEIETDEGLRPVRETYDLDSDMVVAFIARRRDDGVAENTIVGELSRLKAMCNYAVREKLLEECPFVPGEVLVREEPSKKLSHLAKSQLSDLAGMLLREIEEAKSLDCTNSWRKRVANNVYLGNEWRARRLYATVMTWSLTACRKCEVLFCWKEDLDFQEDIIRVSAERKRLKTPKSHRRVPIVPQLKAVLQEWLPHSGPSVFLFPGARMKGPWFHGGKGYKPLDVVKAACERAGIAGGHIHLFRHTWLSHAESWGISQEGAQRITGITQKRTLDYYVHREARELHQIVRGVDLLPELLAPQPN